jgi:hypothetical protein
MEDFSTLPKGVANREIRGDMLHAQSGNILEAFHQIYVHLLYLS